MFSFATLNIAQVKIKERIEIKPEQTVVRGLIKTSSSNYLPCGPWIETIDLYNPWQVVWINSSYHLDVGQQAFSYQANLFEYNNRIDATKKYDFAVVEGEDLCYIQENYIDSINGTFIPSTNAGYELFDISGADMIGNLADGEDPFNLPRLQGVPTRGGFRRYTIFFKKPGDIAFTIKESESTAEIINYHTKVVVPDFNLEYFGANILPHGEEEQIEIKAIAVQCKDSLDFWNGGTPPDDVKYNVSIMEGSEYAQLVKKTFDEDFLVTVRDTADIFDELDNTSDLLLAPLGRVPDDSTYVKIRYSTNDNSIQALEQEVRIVKNSTYPLRVKMEPNILMPGDTSYITLERRVEEYPISDPTKVEYEPFADDQIFDIGIEKGSEFGTIYSTEIEDTSDSFYGIADGFYFITKDTLSVSEAQIEIRVRAFIEDEIVNPPIINSETSLQKTSFIAIPIGGTEIFGIGKLSVENKLIEIMLGETKYFGVKKKKDKEEYKIEEIIFKNATLSLPSLSDGWSWLNSNEAWNSNLVLPSKATERVSCYWDQKYPVYSSNNDFIKLIDLPLGIIRVIGRFWEKQEIAETENEYSKKFLTKLNAKGNETIFLRVIKPGKLGTKNNSTIDVEGNIYNLDSLVIEYSGKYGIFPQFIKAQIQYESNFYAAYRYEPFFDISKLYKVCYSTKSKKYIDIPNHELLNTSNYSIKLDGKLILGNYDDNNLLVEGIQSLTHVDNHKRIYVALNKSNNIPIFFNSYPGYSCSVWDYLYAHTSWLNKEVTINLYPISKWPASAIDGWKNEKLVKKYYWTKWIKRWNESWSKIYSSSFTQIPISNSEEFAHEDANNWLKYKYRLGVFSKAIAQTRIASSYGLLQVLYSSAVAFREYDRNELPEKLNEIEIGFPLTLKFLKEKIAKTQNMNENNISELDKKTTFHEGLETAYGKAYYPHYNTDPAYPKEVLNRYKKYNPISN